LLAPLIVTIWAFKTIIDVVGGTFRPLYEHSLPQSLQRIPLLWDFLATLVVILLVTGLGYLSSYVLGKYFLSVVERFIQRIPGIGTVYISVKQIVTTFGTQNRNLFNKVVLVEFPRKASGRSAFSQQTAGRTTPWPARKPGRSSCPRRQIQPVDSDHAAR
jgi:uncharacterized membrane protein